MPTKKLGLFDVSGKEPPKEKAPTLQQFIKQEKDVVYPVYALVQVIWYPGNWDNYSIECDLFRASIGTKHPLYSVVDSTITRFCAEEKQGLLLRLDDNEGSIGFSECATYGDWQRIGNAGWRFSAASDVN